MCNSWRLLGLLLSLAVLATPVNVAAQACCAGGQALTPIRLGMEDVWAAGLQLRAGGDLGSVNSQHVWHPLAAGTQNVNLEQDLLLARRLLPSTEAALLVPWLESGRHVPGMQQWGQGIGDVDLSVRHEFLHALDAQPWPGIALVGGVTLPSGRAAEQARTALGADVTGTGAWQARLSAVAEHQAEGWLTQLAVGANWISPRTVSGLHSVPGLGMTVQAAGVWQHFHQIAFSGTLGWQGVLAGSVDGQTLADSQKSLWTCGIGAFWLPKGAWRISASLGSGVPLGAVSKNALITMTSTVSAILPW